MTVIVEDGGSEETPAVADIAVAGAVEAAVAANEAETAQEASEIAANVSRLAAEDAERAAGEAAEAMGVRIAGIVAESNIAIFDRLDAIDARLGLLETPAVIVEEPIVPEPVEVPESGLVVADEDGEPVAVVAAPARKRRYSRL